MPSLALQYPVRCPTAQPFITSIKKSKSQIDLYVIRPHEDLIDSIEIRSRDPTNTSPHDPVIASITITVQKQDISSTKETTSRAKIRWTKVDIPLYESVTDVELNALEIDVESLPSTVMIQRLNSILYESSIEAAPPMWKKEEKEIQMDS